MAEHHRIARIVSPADLAALMTVFAEAFDDAATYAGAPPDAGYAADLLADARFIALGAFGGETLLGGLTAYVLRKPEQRRAEVYIYDLAVAAASRRRGIARGLIEALKPIARSHGAWVIYVQADHGDDPAIALYQSMGRREDVLHFDIPV